MNTERTSPTDKEASPLSYHQEMSRLHSDDKCSAFGDHKNVPIYVSDIANRIGNEDDRALYLRLYLRRKPRSPRWVSLIVLIFGPAIAYAYQKRWLSAIVSLAVLAWWFSAFHNYFFIIGWSIAGLVYMPMEVKNRNKVFAEEAYTELLLARPTKAS
jgi:hypothetical protein